MSGMARGSEGGLEVSCLSKGKDCACARLVGSEGASRKDCHSDSKVM